MIREPIFSAYSASDILGNGYAVLQLDHILGQELASFLPFFDRLAPDTYLPPGLGRRFRAYGVASVGVRDLIWTKPAFFEQSKAVNQLVGGFRRTFHSLDDGLITATPLETLAFGFADLHRSLLGGGRVEIGVHMIRTSCSSEGPAFPSPEGIHQDGYAAISMLLVARRNIAPGGGVSEIFSGAGRPFARSCLTDPGDVLWLDDTRLLHSVTPFQPANLSLPACRDVLIFTFGPSIGRES